MAVGRGKLRLCAALALLGLLAAPRARAEGLSASLEPSFTETRTRSRDQLGTESSSTSRTFGQSYRLTYDLGLGPSLNLSLGGLLDDRRGTSTSGGEARRAWSQTRGLSSRLNLSLPALAAGLSYDLTEALGRDSSTFVGRTGSAFAAWNPLELPQLTLRLSQSEQYDLAHTIRDVTTTSALATARYVHQGFEAKYALSWNRPSDHLTGTVSSSVDQLAQLTYGARLWEGRSAVYGSLTLRNLMIRTLAVGTGELTLQQHPMGGLSLIETPSTTTDVVLAANPLLVDGNLTAGAALDIGYGPSLAGDRNNRHLGLQFADLLTPVNVLRVWVDKRLPVEVWGAYAWTAYWSDDNKTWLGIPITAPVAFSPFQPYFDIPIQQTQARYLKVVVKPLLPGVSTDPAYQSMLVTELQAFQVTQASLVPRLQATSGALLTGSATTQLYRPLNLSWDLSGSLERRISPTATLWSVTNGLSGQQGLTPTLQLTERVARQDGDFGQGRSGRVDWSAGLLWRPLPTLQGSIIYGGQYIDHQPTLDPATGTYYSTVGGMTNSLAGLLRADLYEGLSAQVNANGGLHNQPGKDTWSAGGNATLSVAPNRVVSLAGGYATTYTLVITQEGDRTQTTLARADGSLTVRPTSALSASATVSRLLRGGTPTTTGSAQVNFAPLRGELQLTAAYSRSFDTATASTSELFAPSLRWNIRPGLQASAGYNLLRSRTQVGDSDVTTISVGLLLNL